MSDNLASRRPSGLTTHCGRSIGAGLESAKCRSGEPVALWASGVRIPLPAPNLRDRAARLHEPEGAILVPYTLEDLTRLTVKRNFCILATHGLYGPHMAGVCYLLAILISTFQLAQIRLKLVTSGASRGKQFTFLCLGQGYLLHIQFRGNAEILPISDANAMRQSIEHLVLCVASFIGLLKTSTHRSGERISGYMFAPECASRLP
jgi:hypothetical protein